MKKQNGIFQWLKHWPVVMLTAAIGLLGYGCSTFTGFTPPSAFEQKFYNTETNYVPKEVVVEHTNVVNQTNTFAVTVTNTVGQTVTNVVTTIVPQYVLTPVTNVVNVPVYTMTPNASVSTIATTGQSLGNTIAPGSGNLIYAAIMGIAGIWGWGRSYKSGSQQGAAASALSQQVETFREFIKALPNGAAYDAAMTAWLQAHQVQTGTAQTILQLVQNEVDNPTAKAAVSDILQTLQTFQTPLPATAATVAAAAANPSAPVPGGKTS